MALDKRRGQSPSQRQTCMNPISKNIVVDKVKSGRETYP